MSCYGGLKQDSAAAAAFSQGLVTDDARQVFEAAALSSNPMLNFKQGGRWVPLSSAEMLTRIRHLAAGLYAIGVRHGDRVALV